MGLDSMKMALKNKVAKYAAIAIVAGFSSVAYAEDSDFPHGTSWPDLPKETSFPAAIGTIPDFSYRVKGAEKSYPTPGIGVSTQPAGSTVYGGGLGVLLDYGLNRNAATGAISNEVTVRTRIGLGNRWDIAIAVPQLYTLSKNGEATKPFGILGNMAIVLHKQHLAKQFGESALSIATNYIFNAPMNDVSPYGLGWGLGATWQYRNMKVDFDIDVKIFTNGANPYFATRGGYFYALNDYLYVGAEYNWDIKIRGAIHTAHQGFHTLTLGPTVSVKVPKLKNSAFGVGVYGYLINDYEVAGAKPESWKFASRLAIFY